MELRSQRLLAIGLSGLLMFPHTLFADAKVLKYGGHVPSRTQPEYICQTEDGDGDPSVPTDANIPAPIRGVHAPCMQGRLGPFNSISPEKLFYYDRSGAVVRELAINSYTSVPSPTYSTGEATQFKYTTLGKLAHTYTSSDPIGTRHIYDADGNELAMRDSAGVTFSYFGRVTVRNPIGGNPKVIVSYAPDASLANDGSHQLNFLVQDHLGSAIAMADSTGVREAKDHKPFSSFWYLKTSDGRSNDSDDMVHSDFNGKRKDGKTLSYHTRDLSRERGMFVQPDSVVPSAETATGLNRYAYGNNNPSTYIDVDGHLAWFVVIAIAMVISAGTNTYMNRANIHNFGDFAGYAGVGAAAGALTATTFGLSGGAAVAAMLGTSAVASAGVNAANQMNTYGRVVSGKSVLNSAVTSVASSALGIKMDGLFGVAPGTSSNFGARQVASNSASNVAVGMMSLGLSGQRLSSDSLRKMAIGGIASGLAESGIRSLSQAVSKGLHKYSSETTQVANDLAEGSANPNQSRMMVSDARQPEILPRREQTQRALNSLTTRVAGEAIDEAIYGSPGGGVRIGFTGRSSDQMVLPDSVCRHQPGDDGRCRYVK